jgi:hypothetical protein
MAWFHQSQDNHRRTTKTKKSIEQKTNGISVGYADFKGCVNFTGFLDLLR